MFPFSDEELENPVKMSVEKVRPYLLSDGGDLSILGIKNAIVYVRLEGACTGCAHSHITLKNAIERQLKNDIHPEIKVINVTQQQNWQDL